MEIALNQYAQKYTELTSIVSDEPGETHRLIFKVGVQSFQINYDGTKEEVEWMRAMFGKALENLVRGEIGACINILGARIANLLAFPFPMDHDLATVEGELLDLNLGGKIYGQNPEVQSEPQE